MAWCRSLDTVMSWYHRVYACMMDFSHHPVSLSPNAALLDTKRESVAMAAGGSALKRSVLGRQIGQSLSSGCQM